MGYYRDGEGGGGQGEETLDVSFTHPHRDKNPGPLNSH